MSRTDIGSSVSPEKLSGNTLGVEGAAAVEGPAFVLGFAGFGSLEALSKIAPRSLAFGEESIPASTITCVLAGMATSADAAKTIAARIRDWMLTPQLWRRFRLIASTSIRDRRGSPPTCLESGDDPHSVSPRNHAERRLLSSAAEKERSHSYGVALFLFLEASGRAGGALVSGPRRRERGAFEPLPFDLFRPARSTVARMPPSPLPVWDFTPDDRNQKTINDQEYCSECYRFPLRIERRSMQPDCPGRRAMQPRRTRRSPGGTTIAPDFSC